MTYLLLLGIEGMEGRGLCLRLLSPFLRTRAIFDSVSWDQNQTNHNSQYKQVILSKGGSEISKQKKKRGEATVPKSRLVFILHLIGYKGDANFWTNHKAKYSNTKTILDYIIDTHLKVTQQVPNFKITDQLSYAD